MSEKRVNFSVTSCVSSLLFQCQCVLDSLRPAEFICSPRGDLAVLSPAPSPGLTGGSSAFQNSSSSRSLAPSPIILRCWSRNTPRNRAVFLQGGKTALYIRGHLIPDILDTPQSSHQHLPLCRFLHPCLNITDLSLHHLHPPPCHPHRHHPLSPTPWRILSDRHSRRAFHSEFI